MQITTDPSNALHAMAAGMVTGISTGISTAVATGAEATGKVGLDPGIVTPDPGRHDPSSPGHFPGFLHQAVESLQQLDDNASASVKGLLTGSGGDIHSAMIATEKAGLAFDAALAVRNKAVGAYQQIMGMQF